MSGTISDKGYWLDNTLDNHRYDEVLCKALLTFFKDKEAKMIGDFGCGHGNYTKELKAITNCDGFDGNPNTHELTNGLCTVLDLSQPMLFEEKFDWILSLEVGEHIPKEFEDNFIANLHNNNTKGVIVSWAVPGQGGHGHYNEQSNEYIRGIFENLGYTSDLEAEKFLRENSSHRWFKNTIMVFNRK